jgi:hypothetical protein
MDQIADISRASRKEGGEDLQGSARLFHPQYFKVYNKQIISYYIKAEALYVRSVKWKVNLARRIAIIEGVDTLKCCE